MTTIQEQIALERDMVGRGAYRYTSNTEKANEQGRGGETSYARQATKHFIEPVAECIEIMLGKTKPGVRASYKGLLAEVDKHLLAFISINAVMNHLGNTSKHGSTILGVARSIGVRIHDELKFSRFHAEHTDYFDAIIADFRRKGTKQYRHMHRVLTHKANEMGVLWNDWTQDEMRQVGMFCLDALVTSEIDMIEVTLSYERGKKIRRVHLTVRMQEWIAKHMQHMALLHPDAAPLVIEPDPWVSLNQGGFYTPQMRLRHPFVKMHTALGEQVIDSAEMPLIYGSVNKLQQTAWRINKQVFNALNEVWDLNLGIGLPGSSPIEIPGCPIPEDQDTPKEGDDEYEEFLAWKSDAAAAHGNERDRVSKGIQLSRSRRMGTEYLHRDAFWFVHQCDFRGRVYATSPGFSPQGADFSKGILEFAEGKELGPDGFRWLCIHGANKYGYDKVSYHERHLWITQQDEKWIAVANDPIEHAELWRDADKPYQFLAFCFEYAAASSMDYVSEFVSHLPIALDGSCNGLQNFSAMLRDRVGGASVNLTDQPYPADIYAAVATVLAAKVRSDALGATLAARWLEFGIERSLTKKPVMTLPYGSTRRSCCDSILAAIAKKDKTWFGKQRWQAAQYLTTHLWRSIIEVVLAAPIAMDWLKACASATAKINVPMLWTTPLGFPVLMNNKIRKMRRIRTHLLGGIAFYIGEATDEIDSYHQRSGVSPNFVHSMDATHMHMVVNAMPKDASLAMIHDDFGTHACDVPELNRVIRREFISLYQNRDVMQDFKAEIEFTADIELPTLPTKGDLEIEEVRDADYFFG